MISKDNGEGTNSTTNISFDSLESLQRMLALAGVKGEQTVIGPEVEVTPDQNDTINQLTVDTDNETFDLSDDEGDLPAEFSVEDFQELEDDMLGELELAEMDFDYGTHRPKQQQRDDFSHKSQPRNNIPLRMVNHYGDNPWSEDLTENKIDDLSVLVEEYENDDFKSAIRKIAAKEYSLSESEVVSLANTFIDLLGDKSDTRFTTFKNMVRSISESIDFSNKINK